MPVASTGLLPTPGTEEGLGCPMVVSAVPQCVAVRGWLCGVDWPHQEIRVKCHAVLWSEGSHRTSHTPSVASDLGFL